jgi:hypothetical protein
MVTELDKMVAYLEQYPQARERSNKYKAIRNIVKRKFKLTIEDELLAEVIKYAIAEDRYWRRATQLNPHLRGSDYDKNDSKEILEEEAQIQLEYVPGLEDQLKLLDKL